jgi:hypothetical protein
MREQGMAMAEGAGSDLWVAAVETLWGRLPQVVEQVAMAAGAAMAGLVEERGPVRAQEMP